MNGEYSSTPALPCHTPHPLTHLRLRSSLHWLTPDKTSLSPGNSSEEAVGKHKKKGFLENHGAWGCLETVILVLLPIFTRHGSVYVGTLGADNLQYPLKP